MKGIPASKGIGIGKAIVYRKRENFGGFKGKKISADEVESSMERLKVALEETAKDMEDTITKASEVLSKEDLQVFRAYKMVLDDPIFNEMVMKNIQDKQLCVEASVLDAVDQIKAMFLAISNDYMRQRAEDLENVGKFVLDSLHGQKRMDLSHLNEDTILVAEDLTPSDTVNLDKRHIKGFAIEKGGATSHTAIVARTLEIPAVVGCGEDVMKISSGTIVIIDGKSGNVITNPGQKELEEYSLKLKVYETEADEIKMLKDKAPKTPDGKCVELAGNITLPEESSMVLEKGGDGIGLFRTEFLYLNRSRLPSEEEQFQAYKKAAEIMGGKPCIIRTMDIGGDKQLKHLCIPEEENPFLGYRAIRICLKEVEIFKTQLRAVLRAGVFGNLKVMFPMISGIEELREAKRILSAVKNELNDKGIPFDKDMKVGIMIEIPSAAMTADLLAKEVDFFSIGTNDLCQYTLAVDRMNEKIGYLYNPLHLGVLRLIKNIIDCGHEAGISVGMCGEMASNVEQAVILLGLGLDEFSMVPSAIPHIKKMIRNMPFQKAKKIAESIMKMDNADNMTEYIKECLYAD